MTELHNSELNLQNVGFTYPEDSDTDSLEQLKQHEIRLSQTKDALLGQQTRLKRALQNLKKIKKGEYQSSDYNSVDYHFGISCNIKGFSILKQIYFQGRCVIIVERTQIKRCVKRVRNLILTIVSKNTVLHRLVS